ncbi:globin domain-containing protein [Streptomyces sp. XD-27]|uniref:globin domain-containing protein n=1 Tax=Streptomyces sp. XD-27 TaxID=3062779 RepID=UPI0026F431A6|nr:globin domain-containing protein [Streptomyces sp. XD-27]WKX74328.1 globin domain-containing protein [Streptomyces sp. XD-27]
MSALYREAPPRSVLYREEHQRPAEPGREPGREPGVARNVATPAPAPAPVRTEPEPPAAPRAPEDSARTGEDSARTRRDPAPAPVPGDSSPAPQASSAQAPSQAPAPQAAVFTPLRQDPPVRRDSVRQDPEVTRSAQEPIRTRQDQPDGQPDGHDRQKGHDRQDRQDRQGPVPVPVRQAPVANASAFDPQPQPQPQPQPEPDPQPEPRREPAPSPAPSLAPAPAPAPASAPKPAESGSPDAILIRRTMAEIEPVADKVTSYFYALLFVQHPDLRALFPASMDTQRDRLFKALLTAAKHVDDAETLTAYLANLGRGHRKYGTVPDHYPAVGECLIGALTRYATESWDAETEAAWVRAYTAISQIMIDAAAEDELRAPAWWQAEVVSHESRTSDIAVVTVRPDQPYPFLAGQYTSVETPWWPRVWRHYSFASAPRADGLLSFHVKAVPAGWVSSALVHRARPGDVIRLGPPAGSMTVDHSSDNGLLCLGGGTGIAPIKALVEDVAEHGRTRPVEVFYGARSDHDLYDIDTMLGLARSHPWLSVRPVVSDGPTSGLSGQLPDAVRQYGPWSSYDGYLSGPPGMIRSGVDALMGVGIPPQRIRHDSIEELVAAGD